MKRTTHASELAAMAIATRPCAAAMPTRSRVSTLKRIGLGRTNGVPTRWLQSRTT